MTGVAFDIAQMFWHLVLVFFCYFGSIDSSDWIAFLTTALVFLGNLGLMLISRIGGIVGLSLVFVLIEDLIADRYPLYLSSPTDNNLSGI